MATVFPEIAAEYPEREVGLRRVQGRGLLELAALQAVDVADVLQSSSDQDRDL